MTDHQHDTDSGQRRSSHSQALSSLGVPASVAEHKRRGKVEAEILKAVQRGQPYYPFTYCGAWGQRKVNAAHNLNDSREARLIFLLPHDSKPFVHRAVVIPVGRDWDDSQHQLAAVQP
jgi:hypothetical protein